MDKIGPYEILEVLHRGPQPLYRAKAPDGRVVAVKTTPTAELNAETRERFQREAETCRTLNHPNVIRVFEMGEAGGVLYQAMELLEGADLGKVMAEGRRFSWDEKLSIMEQVSEGLQYAHERKLVHRDIKPANLFLENSGNVRVLDFGMVRVAESELTKVGSSLGTLNYMAPEQIRGDRCTPASDVFSAGIVFYQLATGRHPFSGKDRSLPQVVSAIVFEEPAKLGEVCPDAPEGLAFILDRALQKDASRRIQNGGDLKQAISLCRMTMKVGMAAPPSAAETKLMPAYAAPPEPTEEEKTKVFKRAAPAARPAAPAAAPPPPGPVKAAQASPAAPAAARPQFRYCPACTTPNPPGATECRSCGTPLAGSRTRAAAERSKPWALYAALGLAALLAIALIVVLMVKK